MKKNDAYGLGVSVGLHALLLLMFTVMNLAATEPDTLGFVAVELGPLTEGQLVRRASVNKPEPTREQPEELQQDVRPEAAPPKEAKPVELPDLPKPIVDEDRLQAPEAEKISPVEQNNRAEIEDPQPRPEPQPVQPLGGGNLDGTEGNTQGDPGEEEEELRRAPFSIEGLNRTPTVKPLPGYTEQVSTTIKMRITVDPQGRVIRTFPVQKGGSPALERAVRDALMRWRFNALPPNAPQENQMGVVTFVFRLE